MKKPNKADLKLITNSDISGFENISHQLLKILETQSLHQEHIGILSKFIVDTTYLEKRYIALNNRFIQLEDRLNAHVKSRRREDA
jgi:hypothetical protein